MISFWGVLAAVQGFWTSIPQWVKIALAAMLVLALWTWWAVGQGKSIQRATDLVEIGRLEKDNETLKDNVDVCKAGVKIQNVSIIDAATLAAKEGSDANLRAESAAKASLEKRARETKRGFGPGAMNDFLRENFGND